MTGRQGVLYERNEGVIRAYPTAEAGQCGTPPLAEGRGQRVTPLPEDINGRVHYLEESSQGRPYSTTGDGQSETTLLHEGPDAPSLTKGGVHYRGYPKYCPRVHVYRQGVVSFAVEHKNKVWYPA